MREPHEIAEDNARDPVAARVWRQLEAARAMLAALERSEYLLISIGRIYWNSPAHKDIQKAIAQAEAAGIKVQS